MEVAAQIRGLIASHAIMFTAAYLNEGKRAYKGVLRFDLVQAHKKRKTLNLLVWSTMASQTNNSARK